MKKLFALLLAFTLLFLTACNNNPAASTTTGTGADNSQNAGTVNELELKDMIVCNDNKGWIDLPSRIVYHQNGQNYYYSKVDGQSYVYCFDPLCNHEGGDCLANPANSQILGWLFEYTLFINDRFYTQTPYGKIVSYAFDGTDMRIEYDAGYDPKMVNQIGWTSNPVAFGSYIYINQRKDEEGKPNTLRFNTETGEMENLTKKTGNYILPYYFYNGVLYGRDSRWLWVKSDIDLNSCEEIEKFQIFNISHGSRFFYEAQDDEWNTVGIAVGDMKTGESEVLTNETIGIDHPAYIFCVDEDYIYFYQQESIYLGEILIKGELKPTTKGNNGSIYRINHDGTGLVCIYEEDDFEITGRVAVVSGDQFLVEGRNIIVRDNQVETWDSGVLVGTIGADGKIDSLDPVEVVE